MENNTQIPFSESEIISHIKFITRSLLDNKPSHPQVSNFTFSPQKSFTRTLPSHPKVQTSPFRDYQCYHQVKHRIKGSPWSDQKKRKRKPIFTPTNTFWQGSPQQATYKNQTPLMDRINKNVYDRFKTQTRQLRQLSKVNRKTEEQTSEIWNQFLKRQNQWLQDRKKVYQEMRFIDQVRHSSYSPPRSPSKTRKIPEEKDKGLNEVQWSIQQLRQQTQKLRGKLLNPTLQKKSNQKQKWHKTFEQ